MAITGQDFGVTHVGVTDAGVTDGVTKTRKRSVSNAMQRLDLRNTWQVAGGALFMALGLVIILFAWYGSAHTPYIQHQIPYLVSGSFIGLGLMIVGGLMYWAHWLYRIYDQADLHHSADVARQEVLFAKVIAALEGAAGTGPVVALGEDAFVATATGTNVHRADCTIVARHPSGLRRVSAAEAATMSPCRICQPQV